MSYQANIMSCEAIEKHIQCPNRHYNKEKLKETKNAIHWKCNICEATFWTKKGKLQKNYGRG